MLKDKHEITSEIFIRNRNSLFESVALRISEIIQKFIFYHIFFETYEVVSSVRVRR